MDLGLAGKVALVTGGSRGIGRMTALTLAREGCRIALCARGEDTLNETLSELRAISTDVWGSTADVTNSADVTQFVADAANRLGGIHIVVCNVGGSVGSPGLEGSDEDWMATLDINLLHSVRTIRAALPHLKEVRGGSVVMISSVSGWKPGPGSQYGAAKAAEIFLASSLAWELARHAIRVNTVCPGSIMFPGGGWDNFRREHAERFAQFLTRELPAKRLGTAQEVADVVTYLVSERASWINGAMIPVDGAQGRPTAKWFDD